MRNFFVELDHEVIGTDQIIQHNPFLTGGWIGLHMHHRPGWTPVNHVNVDPFPLIGYGRTFSSFRLNHLNEIPG